MMNEINCGSYFHERIVLKNNDGEMLAYVPERTCKMVLGPTIDPMFYTAECTECGRLSIVSIKGCDMPSFCPGCGAKVVE